MKVSLDEFIGENELELEKLFVEFVDDKAYFVIDDGTLIEGVYEELIRFKEEK